MKYQKGNVKKKKKVQKNKHLINLTKEEKDVYAENYKTFTKEI